MNWNMQPRKCITYSKQALVSRRNGWHEHKYDTGHRRNIVCWGNGSSWVAVTTDATYVEASKLFSSLMTI